MNTEEKTYIAAKNSGSKKHLDKIVAPQYLHVKKGCSVMLLRNLGGKFVNGLCGHVKEMRHDAIIVYFPAINEAHSVGRHQFTGYDMKKNTAERLQFPLQLSYGLTIHKSQGMTLNHVAVHCNIF